MSELVSRRDTEAQREFASLSRPVIEILEIHIADEQTGSFLSPISVHHHTNTGTTINELRKRRTRIDATLMANVISISVVSRSKN
jgi:hypothetical protein